MYTIRNPEFCVTNKPVDIIIAIQSAVSHFDHRERNRKTLPTELLEEYKVRYIFFTALNETNNTQIIEESMLHQDIVQGAFVDNYRNMTRKATLMLHWIKTYCSQVTYVIKMDDDIVYNLTDLLPYMTRIHIPPSGFIMGKSLPDPVPKRNPKNPWYVSNSDYPDKTYPDFVFGAAYILYGNITGRLWKASFQVPYLWLDDVYITGLCREAAGIPLKASTFPFLCRGKNHKLLMKALGCPFVHSY